MLIRTLLAFLALVPALAHAQGYFDFTQIPGVGDEPKVQIDLNSSMLGFVRAAAGAADPELAGFLARIEGVRVLVYDILDDPDEVMAFIERASQTLERDGWQRAVYVQDEGTRVRLYLKFDGQAVEGMTAMVADLAGEREVIFMNVVGEIDPEEIGRLAASLGVDEVLDEVLDGVLDNVDSNERDQRQDGDDPPVDLRENGEQ